MSIYLSRPVILHRYDRADGFTTIELRGYFPVVTFVTLLLLYFFSTTEEAAMGVTTLGGILFFGYLWARAMAHNITAKRHLLSVAMQVGDELEEHIYLENTSPLPILWAEFEPTANRTRFERCRALEFRPKHENISHQPLFSQGSVGARGILDQPNHIDHNNPLVDSIARSTGAFSTSQNQ
jgi:hypothetical protein